MDIGRVKRPLGRLKITPEMCIGDELCVKRCPMGVLELTKEEVNPRGYHYVRVRPGKEVDCVACVYVKRSAQQTPYMSSMRRK